MEAFNESMQQLFDAIPAHGVYQQNQFLETLTEWRAQCQKVKPRDKELHGSSFCIFTNTISSRCSRQYKHILSGNARIGIQIVTNYLYVYVDSKGKIIYVGVKYILMNQNVFVNMCLHHIIVSTSIIQVPILTHFFPLLCVCCDFLLVLL